MRVFTPQPTPVNKTQVQGHGGGRDQTKTPDMYLGLHILFGSVQCRKGSVKRAAVCIRDPAFWWGNWQLERGISQLCGLLPVRPLLSGRVPSTPLSTRARTALPQYPIRSTHLHGGF